MRIRIARVLIVSTTAAALLLGGYYYGLTRTMPTTIIVNPPADCVAPDDPLST